MATRKPTAAPVVATIAPVPARKPTRQSVAARLLDHLGMSLSTLGDFAQTLSEDAPRAFEWKAEDAMDAAAKVEVYKFLHQLLTQTDWNREDIRAHMYEYVVCKASYPERSTNTAANMFNRARLAQMMQLLRDWDRGRYNWEE